MKEHNKEYYLRNKDIIKEYRLRNKDIIKEYNKEYRLKNKDIIKVKRGFYMSYICNIKAEYKRQFGIALDTNDPEIKKILELEFERLSLVREIKNLQEAKNGKVT